MITGDLDIGRREFGIYTAHAGGGGTRKSGGARRYSAHSPTTSITPTTDNWSIKAERPLLSTQSVRSGRTGKVFLSDEQKLDIHLLLFIFIYI